MKGIRRLLFGALFCQGLLTATAWGVEVGQPMPEFRVKTLEGRDVSRSTLAGKPSVLVFWNTWCPTCKKELPEINSMAQRFAPMGLAVFAINTGFNDSENKARAFWQKNKFVFSSGFDKSFDIGESFGVQGVPTVVLVDARGIVRYKNTQLPDHMEERIRELYTR